MRKRSATKVLITGACGKCGTALVDLPYEKVFMDRLPPTDVLTNEQFLQTDASDPEALTEAMKDCNAVIHLAIDWPVRDPDDETALRPNTEMTRRLIEVARRSGIERIIYASSNHAVGMYEMDLAPRLYAVDYPLTLDHLTPVRPDTVYGLSKAIDECVGRYCAESGGPAVYSLRIGAVLAAESDHPYAYAEDARVRGLCERGDSYYQRMVHRLKAVWLSRRDFVHLVDCCLQYEGPPFDIFYGISDNPRAWLDIDRARKLLHYAPRDNAELWTAPPGFAPKSKQ